MLNFLVKDFRGKVRFRQITLSCDSCLAPVYETTGRTIAVTMALGSVSELIIEVVHICPDVRYTGVVFAVPS